MRKVIIELAIIISIFMITGCNYKKEEVDNSYILRHLTHSLAHGNIFFSDVIDLNNIGELEMTFIDYYPHTNIESFRSR